MPSALIQRQWRSSAIDRLVLKDFPFSSRLLDDSAAVDLQKKKRKVMVGEKWQSATRAGQRMPF